MGNSQRFVIKEEIGKGNFSKVFKAFDNENKCFVAVKKINKILLNENKESIINEIETMKKLNNNEHSIKLIENYEDEDYFNIVMELLDSNLQNELKKNGKFSLKTIKIILLQLNSILYLMNEKKIIHRDLKLENILIKYKNINLNEFEIKLSDFGLSKFLEKNNVTSTFCGTIINMAPEILENKEYNYKIDLWSLGIVIYQMCFNDYPFKGKNLNEIKKSIENYKKNKKLEFECENLSLRKLIYDLLEVDVEKRLSWNDYFKHEFFNEDFFKFDKIDFSNVFYNENNVNEIVVCNDEINNMILLKNGKILLSSNKIIKILDENKEIFFEYEFDNKINKIIQLFNEDFVFGFENGKILIFDLNFNEKQIISNHNSKIKNLYELNNENLITISKEKIIFWEKKNKFEINFEIKNEKKNFFYDFAIFNSNSEINNFSFLNKSYELNENNNKENINFLFKGKNLICCYEKLIFDNKNIYFYIRKKNEIRIKNLKNSKINFFYKINEKFILTGQKNGSIKIFKIENKIFELIKKIQIFDEKTKINSILVLLNKNILISGKNIIKIINIIN